MNENHSIDVQQQPVATRTRRFSNTSNVMKLNGEDMSKNRRGLNNRKKSYLHKLAPEQPGRGVTIEEIVKVLKKDAETRTQEELKMLEEWSFLIPEAENHIKAKLAKSVLKQRSIEQEESLESIEKKAGILAQLIRESNYIVIYTGAGISTSASIPDYRGPNGLWTQIKKTGTFSITKIHDLTSAEPTLTHMAIKELCRRRIVNHVVSQNCDGLHLRSGIPQTNLSEIHGNMYIEVCPTCEKQYFRQADITERTSRFRHKTGRKCHTCAEPNNNLIDTIVLYGERSRTQWPMNWERASKAAKRADLIICLGSSLKTLRRYNCLWPKRIYSSGNKEPETNLAIINLQYTSKDKNAVLKINGKCDLVMQLVMQRLNIEVPDYDWSHDPLHKIAIPFTPKERAELKRNLIFESKARQSSASPTPNSLKRSAYELSKSPSLFVSELTDDPEKKRLRMRVRAVNVGATGSPDDLCTSHEVDDEQQEVNSTSQQTTGERPSLMKQEESEKAIVHEKLDYVLPGWLGKSLASSRTSSYRRKRHGNKGKKHPRVLKPHQADDVKPIIAQDILQLNDDSTISKTPTDDALGVTSQDNQSSPTVCDAPPRGENNSPLNRIECGLHLSNIIHAVVNEPMTAIKQET